MPLQNLPLRTFIPRNCYLPQATPPPLRRDLSKMIYARLLLTRPHFTFSFPLFFCHLLPGDFLLLLLPPSHPLSFFCSSQGRLPACHAFFSLLNRGRRKRRRGKGLMLFSPQLIPFSCLTCLFLLRTREDESFFKQPEDGGNGLSDPALMCIFFAAHKFGEKGLLAVAGGGLTSFISLPPGFISSPTYPTYRFLPSHTHIGYTHPLVFLQA